MNVQTLIENLCEVVANGDGEQAVAVYNSVCTDQIRYDGDSLFERVPTAGEILEPASPMSMQDLLDNLADVLASFDGEDLASTYNSVCSDQVRYLEDSEFEEISSSSEHVDGVQQYEVTAADFDGSTDDTDDRVFWVSAANEQVVLDALVGTGASVVPLGQQVEEGVIDFQLPAQTHELQAALRATSD